MDLKNGNIGEINPWQTDQKDSLNYLQKTLKSR